MRNMSSPGSRRLVAPMLAILLVILAACGAPPRYDAETDQAISALQAEADRHLIALGNGARQHAMALERGDAAAAQRIRRRFAEPAQLQQPFDTFDAQLTTIEFRLLAEDGIASSRIITLMTGVRAVFDRVRARQEAATASAGFMPYAEVRLLRSQVQENLAALLRVVKNRKSLEAS